MKTKFVKIGAILLFVSMILGFMLYKGDYFFSEEKIVIKDEQVMNAPEIIHQEQLNVFQHLNSAGDFAPENFDTVYKLTPHYQEVEKTNTDHFFLSSSKSAGGLVDISGLGWFSDSDNSTLEIQLERQLKSKKQ